MTQSDKSQTDKTKSQLMEGMRKSKAAGATPHRAADSAPQASRATRETMVAQQGGSDNRYALGGLRWPD